MNHPKKKLGQHFLVDPSIARRIVGSLNPRRSHPILEIGPGRGALTEELIKLGRPVIAVEKDEQLALSLRGKYGGQSLLHVISGDILSLDLHAELENLEAPSFSVIGNVPFQITSPLLDYLLGNRDVVEESVLMLQREVAERLVSAPGRRQYGGLTVVFGYYSRIEMLFRVKRGSFYPVPDVDAAVVKVAFNGASAEKEVAGEAFFGKVVRNLFGWRRKQIQKTLRTHPFFGLERDELELVRRAVDFELSDRPADLSIADFIELTNRLSRLRRDWSYPHTPSRQRKTENRPPERAKRSLAPGSDTPDPG